MARETFVGISNMVKFADAETVADLIIIVGSDDKQSQKFCHDKRKDAPVPQNGKQPRKTD